MTEALKCLIIDKGYIALVDGDHAETIKDIKDNDISIFITDRGVAIGLKNIVFIDIPEEELDFFVENSNITVYPFSPSKYVEKPIVTVSLLRDTVVEAKSIYYFTKTQIDKQPANIEA